MQKLVGRIWKRSWDIRILWSRWQVDVWKRTNGVELWRRIKHMTRGSVCEHDTTRTRASWRPGAGPPLGSGQGTGLRTPQPRTLSAERDPEQFEKLLPEERYPHDKRPRTRLVTKTDAIFLLLTKDKVYENGNRLGDHCYYRVNKGKTECPILESGRTSKRASLIANVTICRRGIDIKSWKTTCQRRRSPWRKHGSHVRPIVDIACTLRWLGNQQTRGGCGDRGRLGTRQCLIVTSKICGRSHRQCFEMYRSVLVYSLGRSSRKTCTLTERSEKRTPY